MPRYQFHDYGDSAPRPRNSFGAHVTARKLKSDSAARSFAGTLAKRHGGPVDLARGDASGRHWDERYMTTASPSEHHASGFMFERLN